MVAFGTSVEILVVGSIEVIEPFADVFDGVGVDDV